MCGLGSGWKVGASMGDICRFWGVRVGEMSEEGGTATRGFDILNCW